MIVRQLKADKYEYLQNNKALLSLLEILIWQGVA